MTKASNAAVLVRIAADHLVVLSELKQILTEDQQLLAGLTGREQQIIRMHFGTEQTTSHTIEAISAQLGLTVEKVRAVEVVALHKLGSGATGRRIQHFQKKIQKEIQEERQRLQDIASDEEFRDLLASDPKEDIRALKSLAVFEEILNVVGRRASSGRNTANALPPELFHVIVLECAYAAHLNHRYRPPADAISNVDLRKKFLADLRETKFRIAIISLMQGDYPDWLSL
jgi:hypothetical protein